MKLQDRSAIVTGILGGLGGVIATHLLAEGARVLGTDLDDGKLDQRLQNLPAGAEFLAGDITSEEFAPELVKKGVELFGAVDVLVNAHGLCLDAFSLKLTPEAFRKVQLINEYAPWLTMRAIGQHWKERKDAKDTAFDARRCAIINLASVNAFRPQPGQANYCGSKAGLVAVTRVIAREFAFAVGSVRVNGIAPGYTDAGMVKRMAEAKPEELAKLLQGLPFHELVDPAEIGRAAVMLAGDDFPHMTGQFITIDSGQLLAA